MTIKPSGEETKATKASQRSLRVRIVMSAPSSLLDSPKMRVECCDVAHRFSARLAVLQPYTPLTGDEPDPLGQVCASTLPVIPEELAA